MTSTKTRNLWPAEIATKRVRAPLNLLREQAAFLGQQTGNLVQGSVMLNQRVSSKGNFTYDFYIEAPTLDNYTYKLFSVYHDISMYPLEINVEEAVLDEIATALTVKPDKAGDPTIFVDSEDEFMKALELIFKSSKTLKVIAALLSQTEPSSVFM